MNFEELLTKLLDNRHSDDVEWLRTELRKFPTMDQSSRFLNQTGSGSPLAAAFGNILLGTIMLAHGLRISSQNGWEMSLPENVAMHFEWDELERSLAYMLWVGENAHGDWGHSEHAVPYIQDLVAWIKLVNHIHLTEDVRFLDLIREETTSEEQACKLRDILRRYNSEVLISPISSSSFTLLKPVTASGNVTIAGILLDYGAIPNTRVIETALEHNNFNVPNLILERGIEFRWGNSKSSNGGVIDDFSDAYLKMIDVINRERERDGLPLFPHSHNRRQTPGESDKTAAAKRMSTDEMGGTKLDSGFY